MQFLFPRCKDSRECFARNQFSECTILKTVPGRDGECTFCKPDQEVTNGNYYPHKKGEYIGIDT